MEQNNMKEMSAAINARLFLLFLGIMLMVNALTVSLRNGVGYIRFAAIMEKMVTEGTYPPQTELATEAPEEVSSEALAETLSEASTEVTAQPQMPQTDEEVAVQLLDGGVDYRDLRMMGILSIIQVIAEPIVGFICAVLANRVDKSKITFLAAATLVGVEVVVLAVQFFMGAMRLSSLLYSLIMPLVLLWAARKLRQLAKADPERVYAVLPRDKQRPSRPAGKNQSSAAPAQSGEAAPQTPAGGASAGAGKSLRERAMMHVNEDEPAEEDAFAETVDTEGVGAEVPETEEVEADG